MIKVKCSQLEGLRKNPLEFARLLANNNLPKGGGVRGYFQRWQDEVRAVLRNEKSVREAKTDFAKVCAEKFSPTIENRKHEEKLQKAFDVFFKEYKSLNVKFQSTKKNISEHLHSNVLLTGSSPWITNGDDGYKLIFLTESKIEDWVDFLKYPIIQKHLAETCFQCNTKDITFYCYCVENNSFESYSYSDKEIKETVVEVKYLLSIVSNEYEKVKR